MALSGFRPVYVRTVYPPRKIRISCALLLSVQVANLFMFCGWENNDSLVGTAFQGMFWFRVPATTRSAPVSGLKLGITTEHYKVRFSNPTENRTRTPHTDAMRCEPLLSLHFFYASCHSILFFVFFACVLIACFNNNNSSFN